MWVSEDPKWRIVKVEMGGKGVQVMRLIHVKVDADFDYAEVDWPGWEPEDVSDAVLEVLHSWYLMHGVYNSDPYPELSGKQTWHLPRGPDYVDPPYIRATRGGDSGTK